MLERRRDVAGSARRAGDPVGIALDRPGVGSGQAEEPVRRELGLEAGLVAQRGLVIAAVVGGRDLPRVGTGVTAPDALALAQQRAGAHEGGPAHGPLQALADGERPVGERVLVGFGLQLVQRGGGPPCEPARIVAAGSRPAAAVSTSFRVRSPPSPPGVEGSPLFASGARGTRRPAPAQPAPWRLASVEGNGSGCEAGGLRREYAFDTRKGHARAWECSALAPHPEVPARSAGRAGALTSGLGDRPIVPPPGRVMSVATRRKKAGPSGFSC